MLFRSNDISRRDPSSSYMVQSDLRSSDKCYGFRLVGGKATHHRAVAMTQATLCDLGHGLLWLSSICEDKDHERFMVKTSTEPLNQSLSPCFAHF